MPTNQTSAGQTQTVCDSSLYKERQLRWVEALESGQYQQGRRRLRRGNQHGKYFCCLGVADDLFDLNVPENGGRYGDSFTSFLGISPKFEGKLVSMNDKGYAFKQIAKTIRRRMGVGASKVLD